jgi:hypothetical protein
MPAWDEVEQRDDEAILSAAATLHQRNPNKSYPLNYFLQVLRDPPEAPKEKPKRDNWWRSEAGVIAKGRELGMEPRPGESMDQFKGRIEQRIAAQGGSQ